MAVDTVPAKLLDPLVATALQSGATAVTSTPYVVAAGITAIFCDAGSVAITLPAIATFGERPLRVIKRAAAGNITITPDGAETILGAATLVLTLAYESVLLWPQGTDWAVT